MEKYDLKNLLSDPSELLKWVESHLPTKTVVTRAKTPALNEYGYSITYYIECYIICERCSKCGWVPVVHGASDDDYKHSCKGRHSWDGRFELIIANGQGLTEKDAMENVNIFIDHIPLEWRKENMMGAYLEPPKKMFLAV